MSFYIKGTAQNGTTGEVKDHVQSDCTDVQLGTVGEKEKTENTFTQNRRVAFTSRSESTIVSLKDSQETQPLPSDEKAPSTSTKKKWRQSKSFFSSDHNSSKFLGGNSERNPISPSEIGSGPVKTSSAFWKKIFSHGVKTNNKESFSKEESPKIEARTPIEERKWTKVKSEGISVRQRQAFTTYDLQIGTLERGIREYLSSFQKNQSNSIFRADNELTSAIKAFMKEKKITDWLSCEIIKSQKVDLVLQGLMKEYQELEPVQFHGKKAEFVCSCGQRLFSAIETSLAASLSNPNNQMPSPLRELLQIINYETKKQFPDVSSEVIVARMFFLRYLVPSFVEEIGSLKEVMIRMEMSKYMNDHIQTLKAVPESLMPLFVMDEEQLDAAIQLHFSKLTRPEIGTIFRSDKEEELFVKRWGDVFGREWVEKAIVTNKSVSAEIDTLIVDFEDRFQNDFSKVPEQTKSQWGERLFQVASKAISSNDPKMPKEMLHLVKAIDKKIKNTFPEVESEKIVCSLLFMRYLIPPLLISKKGSLAEVSNDQRVKIVKCLQFFINNDLKKLPDELNFMFQ